MGLTKQSTGTHVLGEEIRFSRSQDEMIIALAGNPNVGKSTVFNALTGLNQHTGNWPGKTVTNAFGTYRHRDTNHILVDLPGTYSLMSDSAEEEVARDFICFGQPDVTVVVTDATCLERNLNLVLQAIEITSKVVICVNLMDEAKRKKIHVDLRMLSRLLGVPVVGTSARDEKGLDQLKDAIYACANSERNPLVYQPNYGPVVEGILTRFVPSVQSIIADKINARWLSLKLLDKEPTLLETAQKYLETDLLNNLQISTELELAERTLRLSGIDPQKLRDLFVSQLVNAAEDIANHTVSCESEDYNCFDRKLDKILTSRRFGIPIMILLLGIVFWITIFGANYPSQALSTFFYWIEDRLTDFFQWINSPPWLHGLLVLGVFRTLAWVVSVMLPPMAIFFPLFTLLEDLGYLPRIAFNLDHFFKKACACGKQALTMCMGFGCNAAGVIGCRIIQSPRERLIAILTNAFVPCNGRFPTLIAIITMFFAGMFVLPLQSLMSTLMLTGIILLGILMTLLVSWLLSKTILKGVPSSFTLELPPYRKPQIGKIIVHSIFDRTLFVLGRAMTAAIPAGALLWLLANVTLGGSTLLAHCTTFLDPFGRLIGLDGVIIVAFLLGFPANEIVVPIIIMCYMSTGQISEFNNLTELHTLLVQNGWTWLTALCTMFFSLFHFPCATTCATIHKETKSIRWTILSFLLPTGIGILLCFCLTTVVRLFGLV